MKNIIILNKENFQTHAGILRVKVTEKTAILLVVDFELPPKLDLRSMTHVRLSIILAGIQNRKIH